ncbi:hypothetical protein KEJ45_04300 [Candidatus Bathyarchaeota archaeon]|nr:hypothetical protein [Candidatus Bathyarchaeota archaeon]
MTDMEDLEKRQQCSCAQAAADLLKSVSPVKEGMLQEVKCKRCGKIFLTNFDTEYCYDCRRKQQQR